MTKTRYAELAYRNDGPGLWRIVTTEDGAAVGPQYGTKAELLADLERYAKDYGCEGPPAQLSRQDREMIDGKCVDLWNTVFHDLDAEYGGDISGRMAQAAVNGFRAAMEKEFEVKPSGLHLEHKPCGQALCSKCNDDSAGLR